MKLFPITYTPELILKRNNSDLVSWKQHVHEKILPELFCCNCSKRIEFNDIVNIQSPNKNKKELTKFIFIMSSGDDICCSKSCVTSLNNKKLHAAGKMPSIGKSVAKKMKEAGGWEAFYGKNKADKIRQRVSVQMSTDNAKWHSSHSKEKREQMRQNSAKNIRDRQLGKTLEEQYGVERANRIKSKISRSLSGSKNPMYGVPSPRWSGGGISGKIDDIWFRSLLELSFILDQKIKGVIVMNAENSKFRIEYADKNGNIRNYFPDFYLPESDTVIEIKPSKFLKNDDVIRKKKSATTNFSNYEIKTERDFKVLTIKELIELMKSETINLSKRSEIKLRKNEAFDTRRV